MILVDYLNHILAYDEVLEVILNRSALRLEGDSEKADERLILCMSQDYMLRIDFVNRRIVYAGVLDPEQLAEGITSVYFARYFRTIVSRSFKIPVCSLIITYITKYLRKFYDQLESVLFHTSADDAVFRQHNVDVRTTPEPSSDEEVQMETSDGKLSDPLDLIGGK